ncbi:nucleoside hydrolase [Neorhizobium galegae]|uniref:nucleoside hydrolase n=1 Tax=Neorhizobium galegae TaxID=399 RepID=UPI00351EB353
MSGCALHDPLAVAVVLDPSLVTLEPMQVDVQCAGELSRGQVIPGRRSASADSSAVARRHPRH